jgi:hypothetical protein
MIKTSCDIKSQSTFYLEQAEGHWKLWKCNWLTEGFTFSWDDTEQAELYLSREMGMRIIK